MTSSAVEQTAAPQSSPAGERATVPASGGGAGPSRVNALLDVVVYGKPAPQGSKTRNKYGGVRDDNAERLKPWREAVKHVTLTDAGDREEGPVKVDLTFTFDPPKSAPKRRRIWPVTRASFDVDKLARACFDALTDAGVWRDDSQVVHLTARKVYVGDTGALDIPGAHIRVWQVS